MHCKKDSLEKLNYTEHKVKLMSIPLTNISALTYLHGGFGHPRQGYEHFLLRVKAGTQHTDKSEQDSNHQGDEQRGYTQA